jgi:hypothetical protein
VPSQKGPSRTIRSAYVDVDIPPVPLGQEALVETLTTQEAVGSGAARGVPTLTPDVFEKAGGSIPGIGLDVDRHVSWDQPAAIFQDLSCQAILADET